MTGRPIREDLIAEANAGRDRFVRTMILEMYRLTGQMHALAELMTNYIGGDADPRTDEHRAATFTPASSPAAPVKGRSSAMAMDSSVVGAAPAGTAERPPQPIQEPLPAASPRAQNEGLDIQGGDRMAQKEGAVSTVTSAVTASAESLKADLRNSSRSPSVAQPPSPAGGERTRTDRALDLWATTELEPEEIAARVGCAASSIMVFVANARKKSDPRAAARDKARAAKIAAMKAEMARPRLITQAASPLPAPPPPPEPPPSPAMFDAMGIVAIDTKAHIIRGPKGDWHATAPVARTIARINSEGLFDIAVLLQAGPWPGADSFRVHMPSMVRELAKIGVEFIEVKGAGFRIRLAEAS